MEDIVELGNQFYIKTSSALADQRTRVIKQGDVFAVFDVYGDIKAVGIGSQGLYKNSTRFLSQMEFRVGGYYPLFLSSTIRSDNTLFTVDLSNPALLQIGGSPLAKGQIHFFRSKFLTDSGCFEKIEMTNFCDTNCEIEVSFRYKADFADMFEIRGIQRKARGSITEIVTNPDCVLFNYEGLDKKRRACQITFQPQPAQVTENRATFNFQFQPREKISLFVTVLCLESSDLVKPISFQTAFNQVENISHKRSLGGCQLEVSSEVFNQWINRSKSDVLLMSTETETGLYPYAGIPWFNSVFGRDGIITALQYLWINPEIARGVLAYLSRHQASENNPQQDAEPGKILHEFRKGEMVETGELPFKNYYGSADATPLFIVLAGHYYQHTADKAFIERIWPSIERALSYAAPEEQANADGAADRQHRELSLRELAL